MTFLSVYQVVFCITSKVKLQGSGRVDILNKCFHMDKYKTHQNIRNMGLAKMEV